MTILATIISVLLLSASGPAIEDFTGKWTGTFSPTLPDGTTREQRIAMDLKHTGKELSGTAGPSVERQWPIVKGVVEGNTLTFGVQSDGPLISFKLTSADGRLKGDASAEQDGQKLSAKIDVERVK